MTQGLPYSISDITSISSIIISYYTISNGKLSWYGGIKSSTIILWLSIRSYPVGTGLPIMVDCMKAIRVILLPANTVSVEETEVASEGTVELMK